jgi:membrane protease subunit (stomatin/prohibitin family)
MSSVPIRAYGNYNIVLKDPKKFYLTLIGSRTSYDISEIEEFVQGQILEMLPEALALVKKIEGLNKSQDKVSQRLQDLVNKVLARYGFEIIDLQVLSLLPSDEVLKALDAKAAMGIIGNKQEYLLYQAANSLNELQSGSGSSSSNDPMQMMLGLMLGKSLISADYKEKERDAQSKKIGGISESHVGGAHYCPSCGARTKAQDNFCSSCGEKLS